MSVNSIQKFHIEPDSLPKYCTLSYCLNVKAIAITEQVLKRTLPQFKTNLQIITSVKVYALINGSVVMVYSLGHPNFQISCVYHFMCGDT
jgi:hypothetical protein